MKYLIIVALGFCCFNSFAKDVPSFLNDNKTTKIVDAIYIVEGGAKTKYPYGVKSVKTKNPRQVCWNTVKNNYKRWYAAGAKGDYLDYLADVYCPLSVDKPGNRNWKKNIHKLVDLH